MRVIHCEDCGAITHPLVASCRAIDGKIHYFCSIFCRDDFYKKLKEQLKDPPTEVPPMKRVTLARKNSQNEVEVRTKLE